MLICKSKTISTNLYMINKNNKRKFIFLGDTDSINIEIIIKSHNFLKKKLEYIIIGNKSEFIKYIKIIKLNIKINTIIDPINFNDYKNNYINIFDVENKYNEKYKNLLNQLNLSNHLSNSTGYDLITMPIDKSIFKRKIKFIGVTEYLGKINNTNTAMLMVGEKFSVIPLTTHINLKKVHTQLNERKLIINLNDVIKLIAFKGYNLKFKSIKFLCYNPHCSEKKTIGNEDSLISSIIKKKFKKIQGPYPADSAFKNIEKNTLFISTYHDQALIPFKILNKRGINFTIGLSYRRLSPNHGTAKNIKFKNKSDNTSFLQCMLK